MADTTPQEYEELLTAAVAAADAMAQAPIADRVSWLRAAAAGLDGAVDDLLPLAEEETGLPQQRLTGELARTSGQLRLFADALEDGSLLEVVIDTKDPDFKPVPLPDLRRTLVPLGPVAVFGASNFPFAFSVGGGDTASAWAAGCPVVAKAHSGHIELSRKTAEVLQAALKEAGAPDGMLGLVVGQENGTKLVQDPRITAGGFTGSVNAGVHLFKLAANRPDPIPFYGELGSLNPTFVTKAAIEARGAEIAEGYVGSFTMGVGQFCTKPGLLFLPTGHGLSDALKAELEKVGPARMLNSRIRDGYGKTLGEISKHEGVTTIVDGSGADTGDVRDGAAPSLLQTSLHELLAHPEDLQTEVFGPTSVIVEYDDPSDLPQLADVLEGSLTATVHAEDDETELGAQLLELGSAVAGRVLWNGWPTGVTVSWAQNHAGPFPSTVGSLFTSVGMTAARRFQRPVSFQDVPEALLPDELKNANPNGLSRRINGAMSTGDVSAGSGSS